jgi:serine protease Do
MSIGNKNLLAAFVLVGAVLLVESQSPQLVRAQGNEAVETKSSPKFLAAFREVVASAAQSTVRVQCAGKDVALGVIIRADGFILTKHSDLSDKIFVKLADGKELEAKLVGVEEPHDLAMLKIEVKGLVPVVWHDSTVAPVGHFVATVGTNGDALCVGVVSVASRKMATGKGAFKPSPNSGYLGVGLEDAPKEGGAKIAQVMPKTPAFEAKLKVNDVITAVDDHAIKDSESLVKTLQKFKVGDTVTLKIQREEEQLEMKVKLGKRPPDRADFQNSMGSELSKRREGFPIILQHDSVVKPADCGGPLVDLEGRVIGINIARAGRVESWAIPSEAIRPLLADLISGKLAPKIPHSQRKGRRL